MYYEPRNIFFLYLIKFILVRSKYVRLLLLFVLLILFFRGGVDDGQSCLKWAETRSQWRKHGKIIIHLKWRQSKDMSIDFRRLLDLPREICLLTSPTNQISLLVFLIMKSYMTLITSVFLLFRAFFNRPFKDDRSTAICF